MGGWNGDDIRVFVNVMFYSPPQFQTDVTGVLAMGGPLILQISVVFVDCSWCVGDGVHNLLEAYDDLFLVYFF